LLLGARAPSPAGADASQTRGKAFMKRNLRAPRSQQAEPWSWRKSITGSYCVNLCPCLSELMKDFDRLNGLTGKVYYLMRYRC